MPDSALNIGERIPIQVKSKCYPVTLCRLEPVSSAQEAELFRIATIAGAQRWSP